MIITSPTIGPPSAPPRTTARDPSVDMQPSSTYEALTRQKVDALTEDVKEIKTRVNNIFYIVIGSILADMVARWLAG